MKAYLCGMLSLLFALINSAHAFADATIWDCKLSNLLESAKGINGVAKVEIEGNVLIWKVLSSNPISPSAKPVWVTFKFQVLENNDVGIVAASSQSRFDQDVGPLIGATVTTISKKNGDLRVGSVMTTGAHDLMSGHCSEK